MTNTEFSNEFDILAQSYLVEGGFTTSDSSLFAFNEYEKSLFLSQAQEQYILSLYNGKNSSGDSFEKTEEMRRYLHNLIAEYYTEGCLELDDNGQYVKKNYLDKSYYDISKHGSSLESTLFTLPDDLWFITYESVQTLPNPNRADCDGRYSITQDVVPVTQDEFHRIKRNPFRGPSYRRALRLDLSDAKSDENTRNSGTIEIVSKYKIGSYYVRYIKKLEPIILIDLPDGLSINGKSEACECKLHEATHRDILELAVRLALASRQLILSNRNTKDSNN